MKKLLDTIYSYDRHKEKIVALAVHTSRENIEKMKHFQYDYFGTALNYSYNNYRTEDYGDVELDRSENIFSSVILAAKAVHETKDKVEQRYQFKRKLMRDLLRNKKYSKTAVAATIYFIDYLLKLPAEETEKLGHELGPEIREEQRLMELYNEENAPPTVLKSLAELFDERLEKAVEQGMEKGMEQGFDIGAERNAKKTAEKMLEMGLGLEIIAEATGLALENVQAIQGAMGE